MNPAQLLTQFDRISEAPDAIPRLRLLILDLAVRGKLVEQDRRDEPASELLKRIKAKGTRGGEKTKALLPELGDGDSPFELPHGWCWVRFGEIYSLEYGDNLPAEKRSNTGEYPVYGSNGVVGTHSVCFVREPCIVVGRKGSAGALNLSVTEGCCVTDVAYYCIPPRELDLTFSFKLFHTLGLETLGKGIKPGLSRNEVYVLPVAVPPLAEQHRIVVKVDELMALCDRLEATQRERESRRDCLVDSSLNLLNNGADADAFRDHARFYFNHLPRLTTRSEHIQHLRQAILNLAITGKLVSVDLNEVDRKSIREDNLESLVTVVRGSSPRPKGDPRYYGGPVPRLLIADITRDGKYVTPRIDSLTDEGAKLSRPMPRGSLVLAISGSYGVPAFLAVDACIHDGFIGFRDVSSELSLEYLYFVMRWRKPYFDSVVKDSGLKNLTTSHLKQMSVPLPSLTQQQHIVAKIDELMALCDRLEAQLTTTQTESRRLLEAVLHEALSAPCGLNQEVVQL